MTDKKFTDEEIIKALECCSTDRGDCDKCALQKECKNTPFYTAAAKVALDLINRQKAEIERLKGSVITNNIMESQRIKREAKAEAYKEFAERLNYMRRSIARLPDFVFISDIAKLLEEMVGEE